MVAGPRSGCLAQRRKDTPYSYGAWALAL